MSAPAPDVAGLIEQVANTSYECGRRDALGYDSDKPAQRMDEAKAKAAAALEALAQERDRRKSVHDEQCRMIAGLLTRAEQAGRELAEARELLRDLFNDATDARRVDEYRARGEERIPAFISVEYLDRVLAAIDASRKAPDEPRSP